MNYRTILSLFLITQLVFSTPLFAFAQTGPMESTGVTECTGASCLQGSTQGFNQGYTQGVSQNLDLANQNTGAASTNTDQVTTNISTTASSTNSSNDATQVDGLAQTGTNTNSQNTGDAGITTSDASIGVAQVKSDNTALHNGDVLLNTTTHSGTVNGDLAISPSGASSLQGTDGNVRSVQAVHSTTGASSDNAIAVTTNTTDVTEVQNDGTIENAVQAIANTGDNSANQNTGDAHISTGNANVSASLVNLLNTTVEDGNILVSTTNVHGNVTGNIRIPDFNQLSAILSGEKTLRVNGTNTATGANSANTIDIAQTNSDNTTVNSDTNVETDITAHAVTGHNDSLENTGASSADTGDTNVRAGNVTLANTTVKDSSLGIVIVNAFNRFVGFLIGSDNVATPLSEEETLSYVNGRNEQTGESSNNSIDISENHTATTNVTNSATIRNTVEASALTGNNTTNRNSGDGAITTGNANIHATAVNIANTTVKRGNLAVYIVNVFGNFLGNVLFGETELALPHDTSRHVAVNAENSDTGTNSSNHVTVNITEDVNTILNNSATARTTLRTNSNTGNNRASRNTAGANITTGTSNTSLFSRTIANVIALGNGGGIQDVSLNSRNNTTGANSTNTITLNATDNSTTTIRNSASVETLIPGSSNTGNNELNQNTIGGRITTGLIGFNVDISNILNRIILAFNPNSTNVSTTSENSITGSNSANTNSASLARNWLLSIFNEATISNLINLFLNTGNNSANENTSLASIQTGPICVEGNIENDANTITGLNRATSAQVINTANATTNTHAVAHTGNNTKAHNTAGGTTGTSQYCVPQASPSPHPSPTSSPAPGEGGGDNDRGNGGGNGGGGNEDGGQGGGEISSAESKPSGPTGEGGARESAPRVASAISRKLQGIGALGFGRMTANSPANTDKTAEKVLFNPLIVGGILSAVGALWAKKRTRKAYKLHT